MARKKTRVSLTASPPTGTSMGLGSLLTSAGLSASEGAAGPTVTPPPEPGPTVVWSNASRVVLQMTRKGRGGKTVTLLSGLSDVGPMKMVARELKKALGVGVSHDGETFVVQGDQRERLATWLAEAGAGTVIR